MEIETSLWYFIVPCKLENLSEQIALKMSRKPTSATSQRARKKEIFFVIEHSTITLFSDHFMGTVDLQKLSFCNVLGSPVYIDKEQSLFHFVPGKNIHTKIQWPTLEPQLVWIDVSLCTTQAQCVEK